MSMSTASVPQTNAPANLLAENVRIYLQVQSAYDECDADIKAAIDDMKDIVLDAGASDDERKRALCTIVEALFPSLAVDFLNSCERVRKSPAARARAEEMAREEEAFAERVRELMQRKGLTQEQLGETVGVGQGAISNMLKRQCRPQKRTIARLAEALDVKPEELWPGLTQD